MTGATRCSGMRAPEREGPCPVARRRSTEMTRDEALMELRRRSGGDLSHVPGPVIMRAVEMLCNDAMKEDER